VRILRQTQGALAPRRRREAAELQTQKEVRRALNAPDRK
jgi:hypothetical protein